MKLRFQSLPFVLLCGSVFLQGCDSAKKTLGIDKSPPDEFSVLPSQQSLEMPPDFNLLPTPNPGLPRPQDVRAAAQKKEALFGKTSVSLKTTPGQQALRESTKVDERDESIREKLNQESHIETDKNILEKLGIKKEEEKKGELLNPRDEANTLESKGISRSLATPPAT